LQYEIGIDKRGLALGDNIMDAEWIVLIIFLLWFIGRMWRLSPTHPVNTVSCSTTAPVTAPTGSSSGDSFTSGTAPIIAGVTQPESVSSAIAPKTCMPPLHNIFPIDEPPPFSLIKQSQMVQLPNIIVKRAVPNNGTVSN